MSCCGNANNISCLFRAGNDMCLCGERKGEADETCKQLQEALHMKLLKLILKKSYINQFK